MNDDQRIPLSWTPPRNFLDADEPTQPPPPPRLARRALRPEVPLLSGYEWHTYPRGWRDVIRCRNGRHRPVLSGVIEFEAIRRCSCGAIRSSAWSGWSSPEHVGRRRGQPVPINLSEEPTDG